MSRTGRPCDYTLEIGEKICAELMAGRSLRAICEDEGMPSKATVFRWLASTSESFKDFQDRYARAREIQAEGYADEISDIADDGTNDYMTIMRGEEEVEVVNHENIQRSRLRVDARKWIASKLLPKKYGDKVQTEVSGPDGGPIETVDARIAQLIAIAQSRSDK